MKKQRALRPVLQELEDRTVMSFSFSHLLHSVFPFIHSNTDTKTSSKTAAQMTAAQRSDLIQTRWDARTAERCFVNRADQRTLFGAVAVFNSNMRRLCNAANEMTRSNCWSTNG